MSFLNQLLTECNGILHGHCFLPKFEPSWLSPMRMSIFLFFFLGGLFASLKWAELKWKKAMSLTAMY